MSDIMDKSRSKRDITLMRTELPSVISVDESLDHGHQASRHMKHPDTMGESGVCGAGKYKFRKAQLPNPS